MALAALGTYLILLAFPRPVTNHDSLPRTAQAAPTPTQPITALNKYRLMFNPPVNQVQSSLNFSTPSVFHPCSIRGEPCKSASIFLLCALCAFVLKIRFPSVPALSPPAWNPALRRSTSAQIHTEQRTTDNSNASSKTCPGGRSGKKRTTTARMASSERPAFFLHRAASLWIWSHKASRVSRNVQTPFVTSSHTGKPAWRP